jgi:hypothetical protein
MRPEPDPYPNRVPVSAIESIDRTGITLNWPAERVPTRRAFYWALHRIVDRIPGNRS